MSGTDKEVQNVQFPPGRHNAQGIKEDYEQLIQTVKIIGLQRKRKRRIGNISIWKVSDQRHNWGVMVIEDCSRPGTKGGGTVEEPL